MSLPIQFSQVTRRFVGTQSAAIHDLNLSIPAGKILALVGESGSGKTTLLRLTAGLEIPDAGRIQFGEKTVADESLWVPPEKRNAGLVFQDGALFPHLTAFGNVTYGLKKMPRGQRRERVMEMLELVGLSGYEKRFPHQLSGGERQRLALARALAPKPDVLLLDEPFSNLDPDLRRSLRWEVHGILTRSGATAVMVTHDTEDALAVGDQIAVLKAGQLEQMGTPQEVYRDPRNAYCARLFGPANRVTMNGSGPCWLRPEEMLICEAGTKGIPVRVMDVKDTGRCLEAQVLADGHQEAWTVQVRTDRPLNPGDELQVAIRPESPSPHEPVPRPSDAD